MRVTEKGQVTIPQSVRRHLGIVPGSEVEFSFLEGGALLRKVEPSPEERSQEVRDLLDHVARFKGSINLRGMSSDEFYKMLRD